MADGGTRITQHESMYPDAPRDVPVSEESSLWQPSEGYHVEWKPDERARLATAEEHATRKCRRPRCQGKPVMAFHRSNGWWLYCADHLYGRRISNGVVEMRRFVEDDRA